mmetsp:Transcript_10502/g.33258  ORF Transcript_10502/g.33258 Transcript_10502/m.33258 type:complete len:204 (+) Transcript_10502:117-728(+)
MPARGVGGAGSSPPWCDVPSHASHVEERHPLLEPRELDRRAEHRRVAADVRAVVHHGERPLALVPARPVVLKHAAVAGAAVPVHLAPRVEVQLEPTDRADELRDGRHHARPQPRRASRPLPSRRPPAALGGVGGGGVGRRGGRPAVQRRRLCRGDGRRPHLLGRLPRLDLAQADVRARVGGHEERARAALGVLEVLEEQRRRL